MLIILTGKTASGKDTVAAKLLLRFPRLKKVLTTTSRSPRPNETAGIDYNFISGSEFKQKINSGDFIEYVEYGGNLYGTEKSRITNADLIWRIDPSRAGQIRELIKLPVLVVYLTVADEVVLERLKKRGLSQPEIDKRISEDAKFWQQYQDKYDFVVENAPGRLDQTVDKIAKIIENFKSANG